MRLIYAVSDIHGRVDLLKKVVEENIDFTDHKTMLICCGDCVDGDSYSNSYETLNYLMNLQKTYPEQIIVLRGNHDQWLIDAIYNKKSPITSFYRISERTLLDFLSQEEIQNAALKASEITSNKKEMLQQLYIHCGQMILNKYPELCEWMTNLPFYYETEHQIFVHAGIEEVESSNEYWKTLSDPYKTFLMDNATKKGTFYKDVIAGHVYTSKITGNPNYYDIIRYNNHIYLDSCVHESNQLNLLKVDIRTEQYYSISETENGWETSLLR